MTHAGAIVELMSVPARGHDLEWLKRSLQAAIELEFSTIPPYLTAHWSIKRHLDPVALSIREIWREEMLHMAIACNLLVAVGGRPLLNSPEVVPQYPGRLPGGVHGELIIPLQGLTREAVKLFMAIEYPENGPVAFIAEETVPTIGAFYTALQDAFNALNPRFNESRQLHGPLGLSRVASLDDVRVAINLIKHQGEGSTDSPEDTGPGDLAHYYQFGELYNGKKIQKDVNTGKWGYTGSDVPFPEARNVAKVPPGGYRIEDVTEDVWGLLNDFDVSFTELLSQLQSAWDSGQTDILDNAVGTMFELSGPAIDLMDVPIPGGSGNYAPCFRLVS